MKIYDGHWKSVLLNTFWKRNDGQWYFLPLCFDLFILVHVYFSNKTRDRDLFWLLYFGKSKLHAESKILLCSCKPSLLSFSSPPSPCPPLSCGVTTQTELFPSLTSCQRQFFLCSSIVTLFRVTLVFNQWGKTRWFVLFSRTEFILIQLVCWKRAA